MRWHVCVSRPRHLTLRVHFSCLMVKASGMLGSLRVSITDFLVELHHQTRVSKAFWETEKAK